MARWCSAATLKVIGSVRDHWCEGANTGAWMASGPPTRTSEPLPSWWRGDALSSVGGELDKQ